MKVTIWGVGTVEMTEREAAVYFGEEDVMCPPRRDSHELCPPDAEDEDR